MNDAYRWYEDQRTGLGEELLAEFAVALGRITEHPQQLAFVESDVRRALLMRFPYGLFYRLEAREIRVVAFFHAKRDPLVWQARRER